MSETTIPKGSEAEESAMEFPCDMTIKVFCKATFLDALVDIQQIIAPHIDQSDWINFESRDSRAGKYKVWRCSITARSRQQIDAVFSGLSSHPEVVMVI